MSSKYVQQIKGSYAEDNLARGLRASPQSDFYECKSDHNESYFV